MVLQVLAHAGERVHDRNAELAQQRLGPDPGELQQLRRLQRTGGKDHFPVRDDLALASVATVRDAACAATVEGDARGERVGLDRQIRSSARRPQVGDGGGAAQAAPRRELVVTDTFLRGAVEVVVARDAEVGAALDHRLDQLVLPADVGRPKRPIGAVPRVRAADVVLEAAKIRQHVRIPPARIAERRPVVVVLALVRGCRSTR